ncbi:MAG: peptidase U32 family protein [Thermoguttaceae bacterium]
MKIKVLGPAGGRGAFDAALAAGADEIYMGLAGYGARRYANNFTTNEFCDALRDAHKAGVEVCLTLNTLMPESEIETVTPNLDRLVESNLDGIIVQDWGVVRFLRRRYPNLAVHGSTQMGLGNGRDVRFAAEAGLTRVVLPRELSLEEIEAIRKQVPEIELEVFCSGALCLGCSGKCYLSSYVGGRSGNRGCCAQPCRQLYRRTSSGNESFSEEAYFLSLKDQLYNASDIASLAAVGIDVIKVEGRMKSAAYVFEAVRRYRLLVDSLAEVADRQEMEGQEGTVAPIARLFNRGYGPGFLHDHDPDILNRRYSAHYGFLVGEVKNGKILLSEPLIHGDGIVYLDADLKKIDGTNVSLIHRLPKLYGDLPEKVARAEAGDFVRLDAPPPSGAAFLYKTLDFVQQKETARLLKRPGRRQPIELSLTAKVGKPLSITLTARNSEGEVLSVTRQSEQLLEKSLKQRLDRETLLNAADRFGNTSFFVRDAQFAFEPETFLPKSLLNSLRQEAAARLEELLDADRAKHLGPGGGPSIVHSAVVEEDMTQSDLSVDTALELPPLQYAAAVRSLAQGTAALSAGISRIYRYPAPIRYEDETVDAALAEEFLTPQIHSPFQFRPMAGNFAEALFFEEQGLSFAADASFNVTNFESGLFLLEKFPHLTTLYLSNELARKTVLRLGERLAPLLARRGGRVGLTVYGHPIGMYTRKTLFDADRTLLEDENRRTFIVLKNKHLFAEKDALYGVTGSSVFYAPPLDVTAALSAFQAGWELRLDFTEESPLKIARTITRLSGKSGDGKDGVEHGFRHRIF